MHILDFEKEIFAIESQISEMLSLSHMYDSVGDITHEVSKLKKKARRLKYNTFSRLNGWQKTQVARHPQRPYTLDYVERMFTDFVELHGDRHGGYGPSIVGGMAKFGAQSVMILGHQKGREMKERLRRNFGMAQPADYHKGMRLMRQAEKFGIPLVTFIDTPGAYPGIDAEEKGQSGAIAESLMLMSALKVPIITLVIGEGGSGGALAISLGDRILMLEHSVYSVISPEGCASILWGNKENAGQAAEALCLTAQHLRDLKIIDQIIYEPLGGAHRSPNRAAIMLRKAVRAHMRELLDTPIDELLQKRYERFRAIGAFGEYTPPASAQA